MTAPKDAYRIGEPARDKGNRKEIAALDDIPDFECVCGHSDRGENLLGVDDSDTLWCPRCKAAYGWSWLTSPNERKFVEEHGLPALIAKQRKESEATPKKRKGKKK